MRQIPEYLYHYTTIEALASILKNRSIRLSPLDQMDDLQEGRAVDIKNAGRYCFVSCWTEDEKESIPMWNLYSSIDAGVRIRLKSNPFEQLDPIEMIKSGYSIPQLMKGCLLYPIEYTDEKEKIQPNIYSEIDNSGQFNVDLGKLGRCKNLHWTFQREWRYLLNIIPVSLNQNPSDSYKEFTIFANKLREGRAQQMCLHFDVKIDTEAFRNIEIVTSPRISEGNQILLECLLKTYNPDAIIRRSDLTGLI